MKKALLLIRTPFQAFSVLKVLEEEKINQFDIVYFTQQNSEEDRVYYRKLADNSLQCRYLYVKPQKFDLLNNLLFKFKLSGWIKKNQYTDVLLSSFDSYVINGLFFNKKNAKLITFDDGFGNFIKDTHYYKRSNKIRNILYNVIFSSKNLSLIKEKIVKHYTFHPILENVVEKNRLCQLSFGISDISDVKFKNVITFFIGAPFEEEMTDNQIIKLQEIAINQGCDYYIKHPREVSILNIKAVLLEKNGQLAEEIICQYAQTHSIKLVGYISTVMLNLRSVISECLVILPQGNNSTGAALSLVKKFGFDYELV